MRRLIPALCVLPLLIACEQPLINVPAPTPDHLSDCDGDAGKSFDLGGMDSAGEVASIDGDTLHVSVAYGGGCEAHEWSLCWPDQSFMESDPVQVGLEIWHGGPDDMCDAYLSEELEFDLAPLKQAWKDSYGDGPGIILIGVAGESLEYSFE
jgi:hypothetical protein